MRSILTVMTLLGIGLLVGYVDSLPTAVLGIIALALGFVALAYWVLSHRGV